MASKRIKRTALTTTNISMPASMRRFVDEQVRHGGYGNTSEFFRDLVRERRRRNALEEFEGLMREGLAGKAIRYDAGYKARTRETLVGSLKRRKKAG